MKFVFLLTTWSATTPVPVVDVMGDGLTGAECIAAVVQYTATAPANGPVASCEVDMGF